jgi:hypothetical protein
VRSLHVVGWLCAALTVAHLGHARSPRVSVEVQSCAAVVATQVEELAALELSASLIDQRQATRDVTRVVLTCHEATAELHVTDPVSGKLLSRSVDLSAVEARARPRVLALAIAELVSSSWMELELTPEPVVMPREAVATPEERAAVRAVARERVRPESYALFAEGGLRWFVTGVGPLWGGGVRLADRSGSGGLVATLDAARGSEAVRGGELAMTLLSGAVGYSLHFRTRSGMISGAAGYRLGWAWLEGRPDVGSSYASEKFGATWGGPLLRFDADYAPLTGLALGAGVEGGAAVMGLGARVDGAREATLSKAWLSVTLGVGLSR